MRHTSFLPVPSTAGRYGVRHAVSGLFLDPAHRFVYRFRFCFKHLGDPLRRQIFPASFHYGPDTAQMREPFLYGLSGFGMVRSPSTFCLPAQHNLQTSHIF
ncbi:MAG: hypothetical protein [Caudoviricetes sp.]|nr:MAG: hypothetical protein [Caudoviricetes sp.]